MEVLDSAPTWSYFLFLFAIVLWSYNQRYVNIWSIFSAPIFYNYHYLVSELCISLSFGLCLLALLFGSAWLKIPFEWLPVRRVGMISYSLYMWHLPFIFVFIQYVQPLLKEWSPEQSYGVYWLWVLAAVIPFCFLFFRLVEKSGMKLGQRLVPQKATGGLRPTGPSPSIAERPATERTSQERAREPIPAVRGKPRSE